MRSQNLQHPMQNRSNELSSEFKKKMPIFLGGVVALALFAGSAQGVTINFDEFGNGTIQTTAGTSPLLSLGNQTDPVDPSNGLTPLVYDLASTGVIPTPGDIQLMEPPSAAGVQSDLLRFTPNGWLVIYSDLPDPGEVPVPAADVGFPTTGVGQLNTIFLAETGPETGPNGLFGYVPNVGDPGYLPTPPGPVTYNFLSDGAVPEPASTGLLMFGSCALLARRRH